MTGVQSASLSLGLLQNMKRYFQTGRYIRPGSQSHYHMRIYHALGGRLYSIRDASKQSWAETVEGDPEHLPPLPQSQTEQRKEVEVLILERHCLIRATRSTCLQTHAIDAAASPERDIQLNNE